MKAIELTEEHKAKLLEMCKVLFPEYNYINLHDGTCDMCTEGTIDLVKECKPKWNTWIRFHWFEFCTKIGYKLFSKGDGWYLNGKFQCFMRIMCMQDKMNMRHPIDYLYEEFKKIDNEKV